MNILLLNQNWFAEDFRKMGHRVVSYGRNKWLEIKQEKFLVSWTELKNSLPHDFVPELLIVHDDSTPLLVTELESIEIPTVFYSVDTHHHFNHHSYLGLVFTHLLVAQKDFISDFERLSIKPHWLPLWASVYMEPVPEKTYGAVFIGTLDSRLNPDRVKFFEELQRLVEVEVRTADFAEFFPKSEIVINQTVKGDLNFRVFESMMSGALLLTEHAGNGLMDLFEDGKHLVLYDKGNAVDAADKIKHFLENKVESRRIGLAGRDLILNNHLSLHRAQTVLDKLNFPTRPGGTAQLFASIPNYAALERTLRRPEDLLWRSRAMLEVLRITQMGLQLGVKPDQKIAIDIMRALLLLESSLGEKTAQDLLDDLRQSYPEITVFHLVKIDHLATHGKKVLAEALATGVSDLPMDEVIDQCGKIVQELRQ